MVGKHEEQKIEISEPNLADLDKSAFKFDSRGVARIWDAKLPGFGIVVGRRRVSFVVQRRIDGKQATRVLGHWGPAKMRAHAPDLLTAAKAREKAEEWLVAMRRDEDPRRGPRSASGGPTLREGLAAHVAKQRKKNRSQRTIDTMTHEIEKYLADYLDRPIAELTGEVMIALHDTIKAKARAREGTNPRNPKGAPLANRVTSHVSAIWNTLNKQMHGKLGDWNPAKSVDRDELKPKRERIADDDLPGWAARVETMRNPIQRDGLMLALFTGLRSEDVRSIRFEHVDWSEKSLALPDPKGGEARAFKIPLSKMGVEILKRRQKENAHDLGQRDEGWAFPSINSGGDVGPIGDLRQQVHGEKHGRFPDEDIHTLRRTYESVAHDAGVSELDQHVLTNHSFGSHNVNATYIAQSFPHLAKCQAKIEAALKEHLEKRRGKLQSVA